MTNQRDDTLTLEVADLLAAGGRKWSEYLPDVLAAWLADMDFAPTPPVREVLATAVERGDFTYPPDGLSEALSTAFARRMDARFGWSLDPGRVVGLTDLVQGLTASVLAFSRIGSGVLILTPTYPPFTDVVVSCGREVVPVPLTDGPAGFELDVDRLESEARRPDVSLLLLCNPHNPTGRVFNETELAAVADVCLRHDVVVVADEVHADLVYEPHRHTVFAALDEQVTARTVTLQSASKSFNLGGLRCAVAHFGSAELHRRFEEVTPGRLLGCVSGLSMAATIAAWDGGDPWLDQVRSVLGENRRLISRWRDSLDGAIRMHEPEGTYFAWMSFEPALGSAVSAHDYLHDRARVALADGADFDPDGGSWARLNFATSDEILSEILSRIGAAIGGEAPGVPRSQFSLHHDSKEAPC